MKDAGSGDEVRPAYVLTPHVLPRWSVLVRAGSLSWWLMAERDGSRSWWIMMTRGGSQQEVRENIKRHVAKQLQDLSLEFRRGHKNYLASARMDTRTQTHTPMSLLQACCPLRRSADQGMARS